MRGAPAQLTSFVGREREIAAVRHAMGTTRLLTLTGAGGSGKTRLALETVSREIEASGISGAWVELAPVRDPALVGEAVLTALGVRDESDAPPIDRLVGVIGERPFLLVLDNGEHLVESCAALASALLRQSPALRVVVTSRSALGIAGETAWLVPPLSLPAPTGEGAERSEAVQLFVQRAAAVLPGFAISAENAAAVAQICSRLDGLPLALELAAARLRALRPEQIAARLDDRFRLLTTGNRGALPRHQTLRAAMDWSYDLLGDRERMLLASLAVFGGSFSLEAAEAIGEGDAIVAGDILDLLSSLVEKSLVEVIESDGLARYRLLETVREYAAARLDEAGESMTRARRHADFFVALVAEGEPALRTPRRPAWMERFQRELENIRHALAWSREHERSMHVRAVGLMHWFWFASGQWPEARQWLRGALAMAEATPPTRERAALLFSAGGLAALQAMCETSIPLLQEAIAIAESIGDHRLLADAHNYLAMSYNAVRDPRAEAVVLAARPWMKAHGDLYALRLNYLLEGTARFMEGDLPAAVEATEEGVRAARLFGLDRELAIALQQLAMMVRRQGDIDRAVNLLSESIECLRRDPQLLFMARALEYMAASAVTTTPVDAARLYGAAHAIRDAMGAKMWSVDEVMHLPAIAEARSKMGDAAWDAARAQGTALTVDGAVELALDVGDRVCAMRMRDPTTDTSEFEVARLETVPDASRTAVLRVRALGRLTISVVGSQAAARGISYAKARELLIDLLVHPEGRTREQIGLALWPDASPAQLRNNFHVALHHLRRGIGHTEWVKFERERYRIDAPHVDFDARRFDEAATAALRSVKRGAASVDALRHALSIYGGDFLDGEPVGDWHFDVRDHLARLRTDALEALGGALLTDEAWDEASAAFEELIRLEPLHESAHRALMTARARAGDRDAALRTFRRLETALRREGVRAPTRETTELNREIERGER